MKELVPGLGGLLQVAREKRILETALATTRAESEGEFAATRKAEEEREAAILEKAVTVARRELEKELATARKAVRSNSYCWTTKDCAREFEVHPKTIERWVRDEGMPCKKYRRRGVRFRPGDVRRWFAQR